MEKNIEDMTTEDMVKEYLNIRLKGYEKVESDKAEKEAATEKANAEIADHEKLRSQIRKSMGLRD